MTCMSSLFSKALRILVSHSSMPPSLFIPLYRQWAASPRSATSSILSVLIWTSTHLFSGPFTVMWRLSYPLDLGTLSQSRNLFGLGWYIFVIKAKTCQHCIFSNSKGASIIIRMAKRSYIPSNSHFCFFIFCQMLWILLVRPFMWNLYPSASNFSLIGLIKFSIYLSRLFFVSLSLSFII